ncbi:MAG: hypothetical protein VW362_09755 [Candidatus Nanopelagicales bacterium]
MPETQTDAPTLTLTQRRAARRAMLADLEALGEALGRHLERRPCPRCGLHEATIGVYTPRPVPIGHTMHGYFGRSRTGKPPRWLTDVCDDCACILASLPRVERHGGTGPLIVHPYPGDDDAR